MAGEGKAGESGAPQGADPRVRTPPARAEAGWQGHLRSHSLPSPSTLGGHPQRPPSPAPSADDPSRTPQGPPPRRSQGHGCRLIATAQETRPRHSSPVNKRYRGAPTPPRAARGTDPGAGSGVPGRAADLLGEQRSLARRRADQSLPLGLVPGEGTLCGKLGAGVGTRRPSVLTRSRGLSQRDWRRRRRRFYLSRRGVHLLTEQAQCTAPLQYGNAAPARAGPGAGMRGMQGCRDSGPAGARECDRDARGACGEGGSYKGGDETHPEGARAGRAKQAGASRAGCGEGAERREAQRWREAWRETASGRGQIPQG